MLACVAIMMSVMMSAQSDTLLYERVSGTSMEMFDFEYVRSEGWDCLYPVEEHPAFDRLMNNEIEDSLLAEINSRKTMIGDTLLTSDLFYIWKPYFEWLRGIDPHYTVTYVVPSSFPYYCVTDAKALRRSTRERNESLREKATILPVYGIYINDTLVVGSSNTSLIHKGDMLVSINEVPVGEIMKYSLDERRIALYIALQNYYYHGFDKEYIVRLVRAGQELEVKVPGFTYAYRQRADLLDKDTTPGKQYFKDAQTGYIRIPTFFPDNSRLVRLLHKDILKYKSLGCKNIIIDLRGNPGGSGSCFDKLLAIFIDRQEILYSKGEKLKVSERTRHDYKFIRDEMIGRLVDIPEEYVWQTFPLKEKYNISGLDYYVLMDRGTMSTAAALCNILQYNGGAVLVGEPLMRNSFVFGDVLEKRGLPIFLGWLNDGCISTTESNLYTNAVDGILQPDIAIPYVAKEYMTGEDAMLEKLLEMIENKKM